MIDAIITFSVRHRGAVIVAGVVLGRARGVGRLRTRRWTRSPTCPRTR